MDLRVAATVYAPRAAQRYAIRPPAQGGVGAAALPGSIPEKQYDPAKVSFTRQDTATLKAGFGDGTISGPGAAVRTIGRNMEGARSLVPTVEELRAEARSRLEEQRSKIAAQAAAGTIGKPKDQAESTVSEDRFREALSRMGKTSVSARSRLKEDSLTTTPAYATRLQSSFQFNQASDTSTASLLIDFRG